MEKEEAGTTLSSTLATEGVEEWEEEVVVEARSGYTKNGVTLPFGIHKNHGAAGEEKEEGARMDEEVDEAFFSVPGDFMMCRGVVVDASVAGYREDRISRVSRASHAERFVE